jgi:hypothetical protein
LPRKTKQRITINDNDSLSGLMQETYNDACLQINEAQKVINELSNGATPADVEDLTKIAKEKGNLLKVKDSGVRLKLEIAKLQFETIKNGGDAEGAVKANSAGSATLDDFQSVRDMFKNKKENEEKNSE